MSNIETVYILDVASRSPVEAELHHSISPKNILDWKDHWRPASNQAFLECYYMQNLRGIPGSLHWNWEHKAAMMHGLLAEKGFALVCQGMTQGLMKVITTALGRHREHSGKHIVYIDYVETAPWNISEFMPPGRFKGIGDVLVSAAVNLSYEEGFQGRIGLHSLPKAEGFYLEHCGMTDLGPDASKQSLRYFEMTAAQALEFAK